MPISVVCSGCNSKLKAPDDLAGRKTNCPKCGAMLVIPAMPAAAEPALPEAMRRQQRNSPPRKSTAPPAKQPPLQGQQQGMVVNVQQTTSAPAYVVVAPTKSVALAVILAVFFGPLGMLYVTVPGALIMMAAYFCTALFVGCLGALTVGVGLVIGIPIWFFIHLTCVIWAALAARSYNQKVQGGRRRYQDRPPVQRKDPETESKDEEVIADKESAAPKISGVHRPHRDTSGRLEESA
jgi:hypothetical protein